MTHHVLRLAYQLPRADRLRRIAIVRPRINDIFISYPSQDISFVRRLDKAIRDQGFDPWIDFDDIPEFDSSFNLGSNYERQIKAGILKADVFVSIFSHASLACEKTMRELRLACRLNKLIVLLCKDSHDKNLLFPEYLERLADFEISSPILDKIFERVALNIIHLQTYVRLLAHSFEWDRLGRPKQNLLLTTADFKEVRKQRQWIENHQLGKQFKFGELQQAFLDTVNKAHKTEEYIHQSLPDIIISYSRSNKKFVYELSNELRAKNWVVWLDQTNMPVAADWRIEAEEAIRCAHTLIFVVCPNSLLSEPCLWELEKAQQYNKRVIPVISKRGYSQEAFRLSGLSSINYISFVRAQSSYKSTFKELLEALKVDLKDLKAYRKWLLKAYEWVDKGRVDRLLLNRHEFREIQYWSKERQALKTQEKKNIEPLLPYQIEYIDSTKRCLALQRKRQGLYLSVVLATSLGLAGLLVGTTLSEIKALVRSLEDLKGLDALITGLHVGKRVKRSDMFVKALRPGLRAQATTALHRTTLELREINRLAGHEGKVFSVVFSPDGQQVVSVGDDKDVRFWDLKKDLDQALEDKTPSSAQQKNMGTESCPQGVVSNRDSHDAAVVTLSYSSDGDKVVTGDRIGIIKLWGCNGLLLKILEQSHKGSVSQVIFSPGSQYIASAGFDGQVFLWSRQDDFSELVKLDYGSEKQSPILKLVFSPNGKYLAAGNSEGQVYLWTRDGQLVNTFQYGGTVSSSFETAFKGNKDGIFTMQFSPNSALLAFSGGKGIIQVQDLEQKTTRLLSDHDAAAYQIVFSSDGVTLASASEDGTVKLWELRRGDGDELVHTLRGHQGPVYRVRFGPHDDVLATGGADGIVRLWLRDKGVPVGTLEGHEDEISSLDFAPKPTLGYQSVLVSASDDGDIRLWNMKSPIQAFPHDSDVFDVTFRPDGRIIASGGVDNIRLWRRDGSLRSHIAFSQSSYVQTVDYSPNGRILAAGDSSGQIKLWKPDINTNKPIQDIAAHLVLDDEGPEAEGVLDLTFSPDAKWLASGGSDRTLKLWRVKGESINDQPIVLKHSNDVTSVAFSRDSKLLITGTRADSDTSKRGIALWQLPESDDALRGNVKSIRMTDLKHEGSILAVAVQPTQSGLIASGGEDGTINLWSSSGQWLRVLNEHSDPVTQVSFSADGLFLASSSNDGTVRLWTASGNLISVLKRHKRAVSSVEFAPEGGEFLASASADEDVLLWDLWDLSDAGITVNNQDKTILDMLIKSGCEAASSFLGNSQHFQKKLEDMTRLEQEALTDIQKIHNFCDDSSLFEKSRVSLRKISRSR